MRTVHVVLQALVLAGAAIAQTSQCPVTISEVRNIESRMYVSFENDNASSITSYQFGFMFVDLKGKQHQFPVPMGKKENVAPGKKWIAMFPSADSLSYLFPQANAYLSKVTFADGTTWNDDGTHACSVTSWQE
jgi:hypothetical protein